MISFEESEKLLLGRQGVVKKDNFMAALACLERFGNPQDKIKSIHVTGTNGKGSVCALFEAALRSAGLKTGLFISPHLIDLTERIQEGGAEISRADFAALFEEVYAAGPELGFFEILTCMAFLYFERNKTDIAIIEVGIGGRFDTTNVIKKPELCVITSVELDHKKYLGDTLGLVASQKAGIIKRGVPCLAPVLSAEAMAPIMEEAELKNSPLHFFAPEFEIKAYNWKSGSMTLCHKKTGELYPFGILGERQNSNATLVYEGCEILSGLGWPLKKTHTAAGFEKARWPGRFQVFKSGPAFGGAVFVVDGAHNPEAAAAFVRTWEVSPFAGGNAAFVMGMLEDKDYIRILEIIAPHAAKIIFTRPASSRAVDPCALADIFSRLRPDASIEVQENAEAALLSASKSGTAAVLGSFYLAGAALKILKAGVSG
ncbi:MAG: bifunctional folylpolyglutamate synthase/dihydrofolate synthase [Elusimicrobia bacterium]|nr:bifunctional folylpolyglutamate synthase/dihydrofolate synthase [Elusimicrobiota bacterium]